MVTNKATFSCLKRELKINLIVKIIITRLIFYAKKAFNYLKAYSLILQTFYYKECYIGPFVGEFGHLLSHIVPFISYLHSKGVKVHYCGPGIHEAYFVDDNGQPILESFHKLRDFYNEVSPVCNDQIYPDDVQQDIRKFIQLAEHSNSPFWDIRSRDFYWDAFCNWEYRNGFIKTYRPNIKRNIGPKDAIVVFARKKGNPTLVRGEDWDFQELIDEIKDLSNKVIVLGHPAFSHQIKDSKNVEVRLTADNTVTLDTCLRAKLIINQLSGTHYLGVYTDTRVLLLLKGEIDYSNINKDSKYRRKMKERFPLEFAYSIDDVKKIVQSLSN